MSAFICNHSHVTALAVHAVRNRLLGWTDATLVGAMLHAENVQSVNYRYGEATVPDFTLCEWAAFQPFSQVQILKAACCVRYQSCEHPGTTRPVTTRRIGKSRRRPPALHRKHERRYPMEAIDTKTIEQRGQTYHVRIFHDPDAPNPLDDWSEMGTILSLNRRHVNFDPDGVGEAISNNPDAVALSYYEHGLCLWSVAGELPPGARYPWDSVAFAGVWLPDAETLVSARPYGGRTRQLFMRKRARQACEVYTQWCNGDIYGYEIVRVVACNECGTEKPESHDSCWGFYGLDHCMAEAKAAIGVAP